MVKVYTLSPLKTLDELGFSVPDGFTAAVPVWSLTKDGSRPANVVSLNMDQAGTPIHLYARYNEPTPTPDTQYVITYMDGDTKVGEDKVVKGESTTIMGDLTKDGFNFKGWTQTKGGSTVDYEAGASITPSGDMTLYAVWEAKSNPQPPTPGGDEPKPPTPSRPGHTRYIVRWMLEDGTILETDYERYGITPKYDGSTPSKAETDEFTYEFIGWQPEISMVTKDIDYTAVFKAIPKEKEPEEKPTQPVSEPQPTDTKDTDKKKDTGKTEQRNENDSEVPKTGDQTMANAIFYLILLAGTAGGMTICMLRKPQK